MSLSPYPLRFELAEDAPYGASVNPTNGVFQWTPTCGQGSSTNRITLWLTDMGRNMMDAISFTIYVGDCLLPALGRMVLEDGDSGCVPVHLITSAELTNLASWVELPSDRLELPRLRVLETLTNDICSAQVFHVTNGLYVLNLGTCPGRSLMGTQQVAWLCFTAVTNQESAFVSLHMGESIGTQPNGLLVTNYLAQPGRVVVVGEEPLLEANMSANRQPEFVLYGQVGRNHVIEVNP